MRRINDALGRFYSTLMYVYLSVTLGKDRHIHIRILCLCAWTLMAGDCSGETEKRESATEYFRLV